MTEYFYHLLPVNHFFYITIHITNRCLLPDKILSAVAGYFFHNLQDQHDEYEHEQGQPDTNGQHGKEYCHNSND